MLTAALLKCGCYDTLITACIAVSVKYCNGLVSVCLFVGLLVSLSVSLSVPSLLYTLALLKARMWPAYVLFFLSRADRLVALAAEIKQ